MPFLSATFRTALATYLLPVGIALQFLAHRYVPQLVANDDEAAGALVLLVWSTLILGVCLAGIRYALKKDKAILFFIYCVLVVKDFTKIIIYTIVFSNMNHIEHYN